ncbi:MAG TPA: serine/threonine-protein kinase [Thermoleophilia bacterium]|nr:serine/threonine-protein kinase [Thermoleophilia bacterium]
MSVAAQSPAPYYENWRDRYQLVGKIGSGGFAEVFEAYDLTLEEPVALKIVPDGRALSARIVREVEAAASLDHPNIVALHDWFADDEGSILVWELVRGDSLDKLGHQLDDGDVVAIGVELLDALAYAHSQGIVHRDVKPQNVMLDDGGHVKVMDFGIAHLMDSDTLTGDGDVIGTIAYMSPEQAAGRRVQPPSDVYSAGMVLYELLAGAHPLRGDTPAETLSNVAAARLPSLATLRPDLPGELVTLIDAACAPRPAERPTPSYLSEALDDLLRCGTLQTRRLRKAQSLLRPLGRAAEVAERAGGAALAAVTSAVTLGALPAYPQSWTLPLVALTAAVWAVVPQAGLAFLLGSLAFPLFNVSLSLGGAYLAFAVAVFLVARTRPITALWPAFALVLMPAYLTLLAPAAAALLGRVRGPLTAAWAGAGTVVFLLLVRAPRGPFTLEQPRWHVADGLAAAGDPFTVAGRVLVHALAAPTLLQAAVWAGLAAALGHALTRRRLETRLWIWSLSFAAVFAVYRIAPVAVWDRPASLWPLVWSVAVPAAVILLPLVLTTGQAPEEACDGDLQEGEQEA